MEEQKNKKGLLVGLVLCILIIIGLESYIVYDKFIKEETKVEEKDTKEEFKEEDTKENEKTSIEENDKVLLYISVGSIENKNEKLYTNIELKELTISNNKTNVVSKGTFYGTACVGGCL